MPTYEERAEMDNLALRIEACERKHYYTQAKPLRKRLAELKKEIKERGI